MKWIIQALNNFTQIEHFLLVNSVKCYLLHATILSKWFSFLLSIRTKYLLYIPVHIKKLLFGTKILIKNIIYVMNLY